MKVLFVSRGNLEYLIKYEGNIGHLENQQAESLVNVGIDIEHFIINGKGIIGHLRNVGRLRKFIKENKFDLIHAHFIWSGIVASLAITNLPIVVSLKGSDVHKNRIRRLLIFIFQKLSWRSVIVKSTKMMKLLAITTNVYIIPNGINLNQFKYIDKKLAREKLGVNDKKHIIFIADPKRKEKNYQLAEKALELLNNDIVELNIVSNVKHKLIPYYLSAADVLLLTSEYEGSPNVIKEAMACNCPIVSVDVGDVSEVIQDTDGCFITSNDPKEISINIEKALVFGKNTNGREHILHLDSLVTAKKIKTIYESIIA